MQLDQNGYYDLPPGKIASVVTYLEMTGAAGWRAQAGAARPQPAPRREARACLVSRPLPPHRHRLALVQPPGDAGRRGPGDDRRPFGRGLRADHRRQRPGPAGAGPARGAGHRARLFRTDAGDGGAGCRALADGPRDRARLRPSAAPLLGPHLQPRSSGRARLLPACRLPALRARHRGGRRSAAAGSGADATRRPGCRSSASAGREAARMAGPGRHRSARRVRPSDPIEPSDRRAGPSRGRRLPPRSEPFRGAVEGQPSRLLAFRRPLRPGRRHAGLRSRRHRLPQA